MQRGNLQVKLSVNCNWVRRGLMDNTDGCRICLTQEGRMLWVAELGGRKG